MDTRSKILDWIGLLGWRENQAKAGRKVVVTNGCFDLLHAGHISYLEAARSLGDCLLVGLNSDESVRGLKGPTRPLNQEMDRARVLAALQCVDAVCVFQEVRAVRFLAQARPDVYVKGGDYTVETLNPEERAVVEQAGGRIMVLPLVPGKSTTQLLHTIGMLGQAESGKEPQTREPSNPP
jgi:D-glycero-beta-D-manno-heptose 1-phosphate adenylyltransferase